MTPLTLRCRHCRWWLMLALLIALQLYAEQEYRYMGGPHDFSPHSTSHTLQLPAASYALWPVSAHDAHIQIRALMDGPHTNAAAGGAGFALVNAAGTDTLSIMVRGKRGADYIYEKDLVSIELRETGVDWRSIPLGVEASQYMCGQKGAYMLSVSRAAEGEQPLIQLYGGRYGENLLWEAESPYIAYSEVGIATGSGTKVSVSRASILTQSTTRRCIEVPASLERSAEHEYAGYWAVMSYDMEERAMRPGGDYLVAFVPREDGYDIAYVRGARINADKWQAGDLKGRLTATSLPGVYRAVWLDAELREMEPATLQFTDRDVCRIAFPTLHSQVQLYRISTQDGENIFQYEKY